MPTRPHRHRRRLSWRLRRRRWLLIAQMLTLPLLGLSGLGYASLGYSAAAALCLTTAAGSATAGCLSARQWSRDAAQEANRGNR